MGKAAKRKIRSIRRAADQASMEDPWEEKSEAPTVEPVARAPVGPCGKVCHSSERQAMDVAHRVQNVRNVRLAPYWCKLCGAWHLMTSPKSTVR